MHGQRLAEFESPASAKRREHSGVLMSLFRYKAQRRDGKVRLKTCLWSNIKNRSQTAHFKGEDLATAKEAGEETVMPGRGTPLTGTGHMGSALTVLRIQFSREGVSMINTPTCCSPISCRCIS